MNGVLYNDNDGRRSRLAFRCDDVGYNHDSCETEPFKGFGLQIVLIPRILIKFKLFKNYRLQIVRILQKFHL